MPKGRKMTMNIYLYKDRRGMTEVCMLCQAIIHVKSLTIFDVRTACAPVALYKFIFFNPVAPGKKYDARGCKLNYW